MEGFLVRWAAGGVAASAILAFSAWCAYQAVRWTHAFEAVAPVVVEMPPAWEAGDEMGDPADVALEAEAAAWYAKMNAARGDDEAEGDVELICARAWARAFAQRFAEPEPRDVELVAAPAPWSWN